MPDNIRVLEPEEAFHHPLVKRTDVEALVNTVNTVGIMGKGVALAFKHQFDGDEGPYFTEYKRTCQEGSPSRLVLGRVQVFDRTTNKNVARNGIEVIVEQTLEGGTPPASESEGGQPRWIINFPTKKHWRGGSREEDVEKGLDDLLQVIDGLEISSIAMPALGCGNGGLDWDKIEPLIHQKLTARPQLEVLLYPPHNAQRSLYLR